MLCTHAIGLRNEWTDAISQPPAEIGYIHVDLTAGKSHLICCPCIASILFASILFASFRLVHELHSPKVGRSRIIIDVGTHLGKFLQLMPIMETMKVHCLHT